MHNNSSGSRRAKTTLFVVQEFYYLEVFNNIFVYCSFKEFDNDSYGWGCLDDMRWGQGISCILVHRTHTFHELGNHYFLKQQLNVFARIGDNSGSRFLRRTTGILSGPVAFVESRLMISLETFRVDIEISQYLCSVRCEKSGKRCFFPHLS